MAWVLILWLHGPNIWQASITSQEFNSHKACVDAALAVRRQFGQDTGFICVEKGKK